jgi:hypothetical protein
MSRYGGPAQALEDDPVFQRNTEDWQLFHTRYVSPDAFERGLMSRLGAAPEVVLP